MANRYDARNPDETVTDGAVIVHQHVHAPRPTTITKANCRDVCGIEPKQLSRFLRQLGVPVVTMPSGPVAVTADVEAALRERGRPLRVETTTKTKTTAAPEDVDTAALEKAGLRLVGGRRHG